MGRDEIVVLLSENVLVFENLTKSLIVGNVTEVTVFDEVDETGEIVKD